MIGPSLSSKIGGGALNLINTLGVLAILLYGAAVLYSPKKTPQEADQGTFALEAGSNAIARARAVEALCEARTLRSLCPACAQLGLAVAVPVLQRSV